MEIRLRAFDKATNRMGIVTEFHYAVPYYHSCFTVQFEDVSDNGNTVYPTAAYTANEIEVMQWTGLLDRNGVEVFAGDIVNSIQSVDDFVNECGHEEIFHAVVSWDGENGKWIAKEIEGDNLVSDLYNYNYSEVTGHIYNNTLTPKED